MTFVAPTPRALSVRLAEERKEVQIGITRGPLALLQFAQHVFEFADGLRLRVALLTQAGVQQSQRRPLLRRVHFLKRNSFSGHRRVKPAKTFLGVEGQHSLRLLRRVQRREERARGIEHGGRGLRRAYQGGT